jgi:hypothetical protein
VRRGPAANWWLWSATESTTLPALAASDVGIALGCGADLARDTAGVCLLSDDLSRVPWTIALARKTVRVVQQNLLWAFSYNVVGITLAATGQLSPIWSAAAMVASSVFVVTNSLRLHRIPVSNENSVCEEVPCDAPVRQPHNEISEAQTGLQLTS